MKKLITALTLFGLVCLAGAEPIVIKPTGYSKPITAEFIFEKTENSDFNIGLVIPPASNIDPEQINLQKTAIVVSSKKILMPADKTLSEETGETHLEFTPMPKSYHRLILDATSLILLIPIGEKTIQVRFSGDALEQVKETIMGSSALSNWHSYSKKDKLTDGYSYFATLNASNQTPNTIGRLVTPSLVARCKNEEAELYIDFQRYITNEKTLVTIRLDSKKAESGLWAMSTNYQSVFAANPLYLINAISHSNTLLVQLTPYGDNPITANFNTQGAAKALRAIKKHCR